MIKYVKGSIKQQFIERINEIYAGRPWYGKNIGDIMDMGQNGLTREALQILNHMIAWRRFVIGALSGREYKIEINSDKDWPPVSGSAASIKQAFAGTQQELLTVIGQMNEEDWDNQPPGVRYSNFQLCQGVIDHDIYHSGQIALLMKKEKRPISD